MPCIFINRKTKLKTKPTINESKLRQTINIFFIKVIKIPTEFKTRGDTV